MGKRGAVAYHVFDILWLDGRDVTSLPLEARQRAVEAGCRFQSPLERVDGARRCGAVGACVPRGLGGRRREAARLAARAPALAALAEDEMRGGAGARGRRVHRSAGRDASASGALLVGYYDGSDDLVFAGKIGTGFDTRLLLRPARAARTRSRSPTTPFTRAVGLPRLRAHWVRPELVVQVAFIEWTVQRQASPSPPARRAPRQDRAATSSGRRDRSGLVDLDSGCRRYRRNTAMVTGPALAGGRLKTTPRPFMRSALSGCHPRRRRSTGSRR